jgi:hypothetical protein
MSLIRYLEKGSESGAYIFAPGSMGRKLTVKPVDAFAVIGKLQNEVTVFYKSVYKSSCFAVLTVTIDHVGDF